MPRLSAPIILAPLAVAVLILDGLRRRKQRDHVRQKRTTLAATASWENEGGRVTPPAPPVEALKQPPVHGLRAGYLRD